MRLRLRDWSATSRWLRGSGNDVLTGHASKATILIGLAGSDTLNGGSQRDLLFGGLGNDIITGAGGDDLLISGITSFDKNRAAQLLLYAEWTSTRTLAQRTANIWGSGTGPRSNDNTFLNNAPADSITNTVFADSDVDSLFGGLDQDWFFSLESEITDFLGTGAKPDRRNQSQTAPCSPSPPFFSDFAWLRMAAFSQKLGERAEFCCRVGGAF